MIWRRHDAASAGGWALASTRPGAAGPGPLRGQPAGHGTSGRHRPAAPEGVTAEQLGHASTKMIRNYAHLAAKGDALRGALDRVRPDPGGPVA
jgi:hypothetical protein